MARISSSISSPFELLDRLLEELHVHVEADRVDLPALLAAEQVAGAADLEVERGDAEAAAEIAELADRRQPLLGDRRQVVFRRDQQVGVSAAIRAPDAPAQLIELRKTVVIGAVDDDRVRVRDVYAVLDDRRRDQHVVLVRHEIQHHLLHLFFAHLAVPDADRRLRHEAVQQVGHRVDRLDAVVDEEDLAAALHLVADGARASLPGRTARPWSGSPGGRSAASR